MVRRVFLKSTVKIFADDLRLIADLSDKNMVDNDLKLLEDWEGKWLLEFNVNKCKVLHLNFNGNEHLDYVLKGSELRKTDQEKDLGVLASGNLLWNDQIESCISLKLIKCCVVFPPLESREPRNIVLSKFCSEIDRKYDVCLIACVSGTLDHIHTLSQISLLLPGSFTSYFSNVVEYAADIVFFSDLSIAYCAKRASYVPGAR